MARVRRPRNRVAKALAAQQDAFTSHDADVVAIYESDDMTVDQPAFEAEVEAVVQDLPADAVVRVTTYYDTGAPTLVSTDQHATMVVISWPKSQADKVDSYDAVEPHLEAESLTTYVGGQSAIFDDVNETVSEDISAGGVAGDADRLRVEPDHLRQPGLRGDARHGRSVRSVRRLRGRPADHDDH